MQDCPFCTDSGPDTSDPDAFYTEVSSWVTGPKLQSPVLREKTGRVAHKTCIEHLIAGQASDQPELFDEEYVKTNYCESLAKRGTGWTVCNTVLTPQGDCVNSDKHYPE